MPTQETSLPGSQTIVKRRSAGISIDLGSRGSRAGSLLPNSESGRDPSQALEWDLVLIQKVELSITQETLVPRTCPLRLKTWLSWHLLEHFQVRKSPFWVLFDPPSQLRMRFCGHPYQTRWQDGSASFSLHKHLLSTYYRPGAILGAEEAMNKAEKIPAP